VWGTDANVWNLLWTGEEAIKKGMPILKKAGFKNVKDLPRTAVSFSSKAYKNPLQQLRLSAPSNGEQRVLMFVPNEQGFHHITQSRMQEYLNLVYWKGLEVSSTGRRCKASVKNSEHCSAVWAESIVLKETLAKFQAERGKETSDDEELNDMTSKPNASRNRMQAQRSSAAEAWLEVTCGTLSPTC